MFHKYSLEGDATTPSGLYARICRTFLVYFVCVIGRGVDPYGTRRTCHPNIYEGGTYMVMSPANILEVMSFRMSTRVTATVVCILTQILCVVSQKNFSFWGTLSPRPSTGAPPLDPAGVPRPTVFFYVPPNNSVRSTPLVIGIR